MLSWEGYIKCDICGERLKIDNKVAYNDLNICTSCKIIIVEKSKPKIKYMTDEFKKDLQEKTKPKKKKR
jgi:ribosome-binding protein aMBF1 (putative translation factor)